MKFKCQVGRKIYASCWLTKNKHFIYHPSFFIQYDNGDYHYLTSTGRSKGSGYRSLNHWGKFQQLIWLRITGV